MAWGESAGAAIVSDCCTWGAALWVTFPAWLASITHVPVPVKLTVVPEMEQAPEVEEEAIENVTALPEPPPVALTV